MFPGRCCKRHEADGSSCRAPGSFIIIASSNEHSRKILNSPDHAEPCLTSSAKPILLKENW